MISIPSRRASLAVALSLACGGYRPAVAETFTYIGPIGAGQTWELSGNWSSDDTPADTGDGYPGQANLTNNATISSDLGGAPLGVELSSPITVATLALGDTNAVPSVISVGGTGVLTAGTINSSGATNVIDANILSSGTNFGGGSGLTINGDVTINGGGSKTLRNQVAQTITYNGAIVLSNGGSAGNLQLRQDNDAAVTYLNGVISDGAVAPASPSTVQIRYARGTFHNTVDNTYTGATQLGDNSPNNPSTNIIYSNGVFSSGRLVFGGGSAIKTVAGATGFGDRTIANEIQVSRDARFAGTENIALTGTIFQSNTRSIINDIAAPSQLSISGPVYTDSGTNAADVGRLLTFAGSGTTVVSGTIDDKLGSATASNGRVRQGGSGRTVFASPGVVQYGNATEVTSGVLQLGTGGAPVGLNAHSVQGIVGGTGVLEINHGGSLSIDASLSYDLVVNHVGPGTTTFSQSSFGGGVINVDNGTVLINGGLYAGHTSLGLRDPNGAGRTDIIGVDDTSSLRVGQPITFTNGPGGTTAPPTNLYIVSILSPTTILLSNNLPTDNGSFNQWNMAFGAGSGTGTASVSAGGGVVGGGGVIGGSLTVGANGAVAPGASIGTLTVLGDTTISGAFDVEYDGAGPGATDLLNVSGSLTLDISSVLDLQAIGAPADDAAYVFATYGALSGTFASIQNLPAGYVIDYAYNGNSIALVQIPEPSAAALAGILAGLLAGPRRRG